jgi:predicted metal-dependent hydrolase
MVCPIVLNQQKITYTSRVNRRARHLRLSVYPDGRLVVTRPPYVSRRLAEDFLRSRAAWISARLEHYQKFPPPRLSGPGPRAEYLAQKAAARTLVTERLAHFNQFYHFTYGRISVRNQGTRWGSCSRSGNLSFNYRLLQLPPEVADYIVVHELCHRQEFNHSSRFWQLVAQTVPDYDEKRRHLRNKII